MEYKKVITIDSLFREDREITKSSDFRVYLKNPIINVTKMKLFDITIPYSWYRISKEQCNNTLIIVDGSGTIIYTLPDGNYDSIGDICANLSLGSYCLRQNPHTKKVTIHSGCSCDGSGVGSGTFQVKLASQNCQDPTRSLGWLLGFRDITPVCSKHEAKGVLLIGNDIRLRYFYVVVDDYKDIDNFNAVPMLRKKFINGFILARLIIQIQDNTLSYMKFKEYTRIYDGPCDLNKLHIKLIDEWGYIVDLNDMGMSLSLELTIKL